jgi:hypothetical protein
MEGTAGPIQNQGLHCFGGNPAPPPVLAGLRNLLVFADSAREGFWDLLSPVLAEPGDPGHPDRISGFCQEHALVEARVLEAIQACDSLVHQAAAFDLDPDRFKQDLTALTGNIPVSLDPLLGHFQALKNELRGRIFQEILADHGKVLLGLDWRVDNVVSSDRGISVEGTVVMLTLRYREGDRLDRITLQLTPVTLAELKRFAERIEG